MLRRIENTIKEYGLSAKGQAILVGLSGGPDSVALLHLLSRLKRKWRLSLEAIYINHGLRPRQAAREEEFCQDFCDSRGLTLHIVREDVRSLSASPDTGLEEAGRRLRYGVYKSMAEAEGFDRVALGHHADDRVETMLLNLFRGSGRRGLIGMPIMRGRIIRPLFDCRKDEILDYLDRHQLTYCQDSSNRDCRYRRNYLRNRLLPILRRQFNPEVDSALLRAGEILALEDEPLADIAARVVRKTLQMTPGGKIELALTSFSDYDRWLQARVIRHCLAIASGEPSVSGRSVDQALTMLATGRKAVSLGGRIQLDRLDDRLVFYRRRPVTFAANLRQGQWLRLECPAFKVRWSRPKSRPKAAELRASRRRVYVDAGQTRPPLTVRNWRPGDRWRPLGMKGAKKIARFLIDRKVPRVFRDEIPVVCDQDGIIWLVGQQIADRVRVDRTTKEVIRLECSRRKGSQVATL